MAGGHASTIVLDTCGTVWLPVALLLLRRPLHRIRWILLFGFAALALLLTLTTGLSWHGYLMAWLGLHAVLAAGMAVAVAAERRLQAIAATVSVTGLILLWVQDGAVDWQYVMWSVACVLCLGAGFGICWATVLRAEQQKTTVLNGRLLRSNDMYRQQVQAAGAARQKLRKTEDDLRVEKVKRGAAEDELTALRTGYDRVYQDAQALRVERDRARREADELRSARQAPGTGPERPDQSPARAVVLRFFLVPEPGTEPAPVPVQVPAPDAKVRLGIERTVVSVPKTRLDSVSSPRVPGQERASGLEGPLSEVSSAAAASLATELTKSLAPSDRWLSAHSYAAEDIAQALDQVPGWLHQLVADPVQHAASQIGLPPPAGAAIGTVAAQAAFSRVTVPMARAARCCEIAGVVVGAATGLHPVAAACVKMLAHDVASKTLTRHLTDLVKVPGWKTEGPSAPELRPPSAPAAEERPAPRIAPPHAPRPGGIGRWW